MENRIEQLKKLMLKGHCTESKSMVHNTCDNTEALMNTYFYFIKACTQKDFPKLDFLREYFGEQVAPYGGYIDAKGEQIAHKKNVLLGDSSITMQADSYNIVNCWVRHNSKLQVHATDHCHLHIDCFDNAEVQVNIESKHARVFINQYGDSHVTVSGNSQNACITSYSSKTYK